MRTARFEPRAFLVTAVLSAVGVVVAYAAGQAVASDLRVALAITIITSFLIVSTLAAQLSTYFVLALAFLLAGYALLDKGFAYLGVPPLFVGEAVLILALATLLLGRKERPIADGLTIMLLAFMGLGLVRALPYYSRYELDTARDSVIWIYGAFALTLSLVLRAEHFKALVALFGRLTIPFLITAPILVLLPRISDSILLRWPLSNSPVLDYKGGDYAVHLAGVAAFILLGLWASTGLIRGRNAWLVWLLWMPGLAISLLGRSSLLTVVLTTAIAALLSKMVHAASPVMSEHGHRQAELRRPHANLLPLVVLLLISVFATLVFSPNIEVESRSISLGQLQQNFTTIFDSQDETADRILRANRNFRTDWWNTIIDYTFGGPHFWTGKGFGVNLAASDGFITDQTLTLRSPHSIHFNILGRMGIPGLALWIALQLSFAVSLFRALLRARGGRDLFWARINAWILVYWLAFMINASFDVYLEGPQGGIWFWCVFGFGLAALRIQAEESRAVSSSPSLPLTGTLHAHPSRP